MKIVYMLNTPPQANVYVCLQLHDADVLTEVQVVQGT